jgi:Domain of unknown function (DUF4124)
MPNEGAKTMSNQLPFPHEAPSKGGSRPSAWNDGWKRSVLLAGLLLILALAYTASREARAATYKWVDEKGIVHYSDKMPPDAVNRAHVELDRQGRQVTKIDRALTPEEIRARAADADRQRQEAKEQEIVARRDRALLASYTREEDLDLARARALTTIDGQMQSARVYAAALTKRQQELNDLKQASGSKGAPPAVERELESVDSELAKTNALIEAKRQESLGVAAKYDTDKQRWRTLKANADAAAGTISTPSGGATATVLPTSTMR